MAAAIDSRPVMVTLRVIAFYYACTTITVLAGEWNMTMAAEPLASSAETSVVDAASAREVSENFREQVERAAASIPRPVWRGLQQRGWSMQLTSFLGDVAPELRAESPRGWPKERSWDSVEAVHLPRSRRLVLAEWFRDVDGTRRANQRVAGVLRHEVGHAFDMFSAREGRFHSAGPSFRQAYSSDTAVMDAQTRSELKYFLQRGPAGRQETFAEAFAIECGGGSDEPHQQLFARAFPRVVKEVRLTLERYQPASDAIASAKKQDP